MSEEGEVKIVYVTRAQRDAAQYLIERLESKGLPVRPAYRLIAAAKEPR